MATTTSEIVRTILANALSTGSSDRSFASEEKRKEYHRSFEGEGDRKIQFVVEDLRSLQDAKVFDPKRTVALSVGGTDGSDVLALMKRLNLKAGVLLEYDTDAALKARENAQAMNQGGEVSFHVVIGDATQKLDEALDKAKVAGKECDTLVVLCFGVLHELPRRSPNYCREAFFDKIFMAFPSVLIYCAEPCAQPEGSMGWPETVEMGFPDVEGDQLAGVARFVRDRLFDGKGNEPQPRSRFLVRMHRDLAVEVLHKVLRFDSMDRFHHEMQERLTSFDVQNLVSLVSSRICDVEQEVTYRTSGGFRKEYQKHGIMVRDERGTPLPLPFTHCRLILRRFSRPEKTADTHPPTDCPTTTPTPPGDVRPAPSATHPNLGTGLSHSGPTIYTQNTAGGNIISTTNYHTTRR